VVLITSPGLGILDVTSAPAGVNPVQTIAAGTSNGTPLLMSAASITPWLAAKATGSTIQISADRTKAPGGLSTGFVTVTSTNSTIGQVTIPVVVITQPLISRVANAATFQDGPVAPGQIVTLGGPNTGPASPTGLALDDSGNVATSLAGTQVLFDGTPAPLVYASGTQISAVVPYDVGGKATVAVQVVSNGILSSTFKQNVGLASPGLFTSNSSGQGAGAILNSDSKVNSPSNPADKGSIVVLYATGEGLTDPAGITGKVTAVSALTPKPLLPVSVQIDGREADVLFSGEAPGFVSGVLQVNVRVPSGARSGDLPVVLGIGTIASPGGVTVSVR
jgi:trimeric autotransporter adhesin